MTTLASALSLSGTSTTIVIGNTLLAPAQMAQVKTLYGDIRSGNASETTPREFGATSGYQVPVGKVGIVIAAQFINTAGTADPCGLGTSTADAGLHAVAPGGIPAGVDIVSQSTNLGSIEPFATAPLGRIERSLMMRVPAGRYLYFTGNANSIIHGMFYVLEIASDATDL